jgi:hypothetical protein
MFSHSQALSSRMGVRKTPQHKPQVMASNNPGITFLFCPLELLLYVAQKLRQNT